ncbi:penicillin-binding protein [Lentzea flava]|uniref:Penicillin-binding protein n=2 Tax=Lentzea flava TaxID=103732 RepID=A0ABQ2V7G1_9PSEU|nr:penicillin-binding protein [Lentzea flava]
MLVTATVVIWTRLNSSRASGLNEKLEVAAQGFVAAFNTGDIAAAAAHTDAEQIATKVLARTKTGMTAKAKYEVRLGTVPLIQDRMMTVKLAADVSWTLPSGSRWNYQTTFIMNRDNGHWRLHWSPTVLHPLLGVDEALTFLPKASDGVLRDRDGEPIPKDTGDYAKAVIPGVRTALTENGGAGWQVAAVDPSGRVVNSLVEESTEGTKPFTLTLDKSVQAAAQGALDAVQKQAAIVALDVASGEILAIAENRSAQEVGPVALSLFFEPGSTFKMVTAAAAMQQNSLIAETQVECPGKVTIGTRQIPNDGGFELGKVPLRKAFAQSCNTTFGKLAADLPGDALPKTALGFGLGADFAIAGISTNTAKVPSAQDVAAKVENGIGQGKVQVTPFGMALAAATVAAGGKTPTPKLIREIPTIKNTDLPGLAPNVATALGSMMRDVVTSGTATALAPFGQVHGKTGTAQFGDGSRAHGWFVGYQRNMAFAVLIVDGGSSKAAVDVTRNFLSAL